MTGIYTTDKMRAAIGQVYERLVAYPIGISDIRRWAVATYYPELPPPEFWDEDHAKQTRYGGIVAPQEFNPFAWMTQDPKGLPRDPTAINRIEDLLGIPGPNLSHGLNGGMEVQYGAVRMKPGDVITSESAVVSYAEKSGRLGQMLITRTVSTWTNQEGATVKRFFETLIRY